MKKEFEREVVKLRALYERSPAAFWKTQNVGKLTDRQRRYLEKTAELRANDPFGAFS